ncbi:hypothetical protein, partial [Ochrobactrum sp. SFR4]|uniref:hypothetical protein n=1 Tax=Ochrobactrum sp. SFR4 TaxID=2717368 RepID=UPI001C8BCC23
MKKKNDTALRMAEFKQNLARKSAIPFNSSTPAKPMEPVKPEALSPVAVPTCPSSNDLRLIVLLKIGFSGSVYGL